MAKRVLSRAPLLLQSHPVDVFVGRGKIPRIFAAPDFEAAYRDTLLTLNGPAVCVLEHVGFSSLIAINEQYGIPTIACPQNIESFDRHTIASPASAGGMHRTALEFADEIQALARCRDRLFISKVETGIVGGLGLSARYYPYRPVGEIRASMLRIRKRRSGGTPDRHLFLMLGSAGHSTTRDAFAWFLRSARDGGLPETARVVVAGSKTRELAAGYEPAPRVETRGWVSQDDLEDLLSRVSAVLVPQRRGFGALTRLAEMACAGVPVIVSHHPTYALNPPPGVTVVDDAWSSWRGAMIAAGAGPAVVDWTDYRSWEACQPSPLVAMVQRLASEV